MTDESLVDWGASGRVDSYGFELVDPFTLAKTGDVEGVGGSMTWAYDSDTQLQATLTLGEADYLQDGYHRMVRVTDTVRVGDFERSYQLGTLFVSNVSGRVASKVEQRKLTCYGPLYRFTQDVMAQDFTRATGTNCVDNIRYIVEVNGGVLRLGDGVDTSRTHTQQVHFPVGYNRMDALRTYAGWIGCEIVGGDDGSVVLREYVPYARREPVYTFEEGARCVYLAGVDWETNRDEPINRVVAYFSRQSKQKDDPYPLADSCHVELSEAEEYSYERCGRWRTQVLQVTEPCSHADLVAQAERLLEDRSAVYYAITIEHAGIPWLRPGDCVRYNNRSDMRVPSESIGVVTQMSVSSLGPMCMTQSKILCVR